jgi:hypothetical protein
MAEQRIGMNELLREKLARRRAAQTPPLSREQAVQREREAAARADAEAEAGREQEMQT